MIGSNHQLEGKVAWITGSSRGIGRFTALALAQAGAQVVLCSRSQTEIDNVANEIKSKRGQALAVECDVSQRAQVESLVKQVNGRWGTIDILVNNAGIAVFDNVQNTDAFHILIHNNR